MENDRRKVSIETVLNSFESHAKEDVVSAREIKDEIAKVKDIHDNDQTQRKEFETTINRVLFGDKNSDEKGMKEKVDEMHTLLVQAKNVGGFFGGIKALAGWLLVIGALIALFKGWIAGLFAWALITK